MLKNLLKKIYISKYIVPIINILGRPWKGKGAILMYHRVIPDNQIKKELDSGLAVSCSSFENQMKALKDTEMFEFSTQHFDSDSIRLIKGD